MDMIIAGAVISIPAHGQRALDDDEFAKLATNTTQPPPYPPLADRRGLVSCRLAAVVSFCK